MRIDVLDFVGEWTEVKLEILRKYAKAYSDILNAQPRLEHWYIDAFAGAGMHISKKGQRVVTGSPINALQIEPRFKRYYFVDKSSEKCRILRQLTEEELASCAEPKPHLTIENQDCNDYLIKNLFPQLTYDTYRRALCILDPYGLHLDWEVLKVAGSLATIDIFLNFPMMDINRNILHRDLESVDPHQRERMDRFCGGNWWQSIVYQTDRDLFGHPEKTTCDELVREFGNRLKRDAGFKYVAEPIAMKSNSQNILYYLYFASPKGVAKKIASDVIDKYRK